MIKTGKVTDSSTGKGIPYASVELTDQFGTYLGVGTSCDVNGSFALDSTLMKAGTFLRISSVGYQTMSFPYTLYGAYTNFELNQEIESLPGITITSTKKADNNTLIAAGLGLAVLLFLLKKRA